MNWLKRSAVIATALIGTCLFALVGAIAWENFTAVQVTFIDDSPRTVILTDCSTDLVELAPGTTHKLAIAADHPKECFVEYLTRSGDPSSYACLVMPPHLGSETVVRISSARPERGGPFLCPT